MLDAVGCGSGKGQRGPQRGRFGSGGVAQDAAAAGVRDGAWHGGVFLKGNMDLSHPLNFGYIHKTISLYKNNLVWLNPSKSPYGTPVTYDETPHIDGYISDDIRKNYLPKAAAVVVSSVGKGRVIMFAENPNFRGTTYGTNRMFLNALFLGNHIAVPKQRAAEHKDH